MTSVRLPQLLRPRPSAQLIRLGRNNDGGYLVDKRDVEGADGLVSFGLYDDWSFEKAFLAGRDLSLHSYDASLSLGLLLKLLDRTLHRRLKLRRVASAFKKVFDYPWFFSGERRHIRKFVGQQTSGAYIAIDDVFKAAAAAGITRPFLKIDIEGGEYDLLDALVGAAGQTTGLVIEFHTCDKELKLITDFVERYPLTLAHVHGNNNTSVDAAGIPLTMELTFSSQTGESIGVHLPHPLDMPCHPARPEIPLAFAPA